MLILQELQSINPLEPGVAYIYPLKTSENLKGKFGKENL